MPDVETSLPLARSIRRDLRASQATGAPPLGHLVGLHREPRAQGDVGYVLALDPDRPAMAGGAGILEVSMLLDLALGGVIRNRVGLAAQMPTISMTVQLAPDRVAEAVSADAEITALVDRSASARSRLRTASGEVVGVAVGVFALPQLPYEGPGRAMPWAVADVRSADEEMHGPVDESVVNELLAHTTGSADCAWGTTHVRGQLQSSSEQSTFAPSAVMANRLGHIQGGALLSSAVMAAAERGGFAPETFVSGTIAFLEPADLGEPVLLRVSVVKSSGRSLFADVSLEQGDRTCCRVSTVFRR